MAGEYRGKTGRGSLGPFHFAGPLNARHTHYHWTRTFPNPQAPIGGWNAGRVAGSVAGRVERQLDQGIDRLKSPEPQESAVQLLTGYSYPTVRGWARGEGLQGHLTTVQAGRTQRFTATMKGRQAWWRMVQVWWPTWRRRRWPRPHGPATVHWARWSRRLPEHTVGSGASAPADGKPETWIWATGADHLAACGRLLQTYDGDVWMSASAWREWKDQAKIVAPPSEARDWPGTRVSVAEDDDPLVRLLCARAGMAHPSWQGSPLPPLAHQRTPLLDGLPLLDALAATDARVVEQGQAALAIVIAKALV